MVRSKTGGRKGPGKSAENSRERIRRREVDVTGWVTRWEAAEMLGVTQNTIINYQRKRLLVPEEVRMPDRGGVERVQYLYDPKQVAAMQRTNQRAPRVMHEGELAARCFELLNEGKTIREIVIALRQEPTKIEQLWKQWLDLGGANDVIGDEARRALESILGRFKGVADLVDLVRELASRQRTASK